jgi:saccharopine dehydrogenase-like NADP-dependent oxidoreductase
VTVVGCGEMGEEAVRDLHRFGPFEEILVATRRPDRARSALADLGPGPRVVVEGLDVADGAALRQVLSGAAVAVNCAGPNYRNEVRVARAAIEARVPLVDINDDYEATFEMLALDGAAREAGIVVVLGLGASPGLTNVLVRAAAEQLDAVEEIHTAWVMSAADPGGLALSYHLVHSLPRTAFVVEDGRLTEVRPFVDGRERLEFPVPVGPVEVFHIGHPEPITLGRTYPDARHVCDKATFVPPVVNEWIVALGRIAREAPSPLTVAGREVLPEDFAASCLRAMCKGIPGVEPAGALRVEVAGRSGRRRRRVFFSSAGRLATGTGIPAAIGAIMIAEGKVTEKGVRPPEACLDPTELLYQLFDRRNAGKLNGWSEGE